MIFSVKHTDIGYLICVPDWWFLRWELMEWASGRNDTKNECEKTRQKIARIESKMRQGYRASQGVKMEDELRRLRKLRSKQCR